MRMAVYIIRRVALVVPVVVGVMTVVFLLIAALPIPDQILAQHTAPAGRVKCAPTAAYCSCASLGLPGNSTCANPTYWRIYHQLGLDQPIPVQWAKFMYRSLTFQWGNVANQSTLVAQQPYANYKAKPVTELLGAMLPYTLELAMLALIIILAISIPLGNLAAVNRNRPIDQASRILSFSGFALPAYFLGSVVLMGAVLLLASAAHGVLALATPWCPTHAESVFNEFYGSWPTPGCYTGALDPATNYPAWLVGGLQSTPTGFPTIDAVIHHQYWLAVDTVIRLLLPALVIAYGAIAGLLRFVRNSMLEVMNLDYIRTARAKGVPERAVVRKHAGRNSMNVTITVLGLTFAFFIGGFPVIEEVFSLNGIGRALALAVQANGGGSFDFGTIFGSTLLFTFLVVAANIIVDVLYAYLDPRVRLG